MEDSVKRKRTLTDKGLEYNKEQKKRHRNQLAQKLSRKQDEITLMIDELENINIIKEVYSDWITLYGNFLDCNHAYYDLLGEKERNADFFQWYERFDCSCQVE